MASIISKEPCHAYPLGTIGCVDRSQCWEPCGELGKSMENAQTSMPPYGNVTIHLKPYYKHQGEISFNRPVTKAQWDAINAIFAKANAKVGK